MDSLRHDRNGNEDVDADAIAWDLPSSTDEPINYLGLNACDLIALLIERDAVAALYRDIAIAALRGLAHHEPDLVRRRGQSLDEDGNA